MSIIPSALKITTISLASMLLVSACGGGGGESSAPTPSPTPTPPPMPTVTLEDYMNVAGVNTLSTVDSLLQLSFVGQEPIFYASNLRLNAEQSCKNYGVYEHELIDNDNDQKLSAGDRFSTSFTACFLDSLQGQAEGKITYDIEALDTEQGFTAIIDASELRVDEAVNLVGKLELDYAVEETQNSLTITTIGEVKVMVDSELILTLSELSIDKNENFETAKYSVSANGIIKDEGFGGTYSFEQVSPFIGYFNEYPNEGELTVSTSATDVLTIEANAVEDSSFFEVSYGNITLSIDWNDAIDGAMMAFNGQVPDYIEEHSSDNFAYVTVLNNYSVDNFGLQDSVKFMFSRPIESAESDQGELAFELDEWPFTKISANLEINGALVTVTPTDKLDADKPYAISRMFVTSANQQSLYFTAPLLQTRNDIVPSLESQSAFYRLNDTPWLSALSTVNNTNGQLSYQWSEVSSIGVTFDTPNAGQTNFEVPESANEDLTFEVTVTNEVGYSVTKTTTISYIPSTGTFLSIDSPEGEHIGDGQKLSYTDEDGVFTFDYNESNPHYIGMSFEGDKHWNLNLAAPEAEAIDVGVYEDAIRHPFQSPDAPGLSFYGSGGSCNEILGMFEIYELAINESGTIESFAVYFEQMCESTGPALKGQVRFNSQVPLNP